MKIIVKQTRSGDFDRWLHFIEIVEPNFMDLSLSKDEHFCSVIKKNIERETGLYVEDEKGHIIGGITYSTNQNHISWLAVHPSYRRHGIASALMRKVIEKLSYADEIRVKTFLKDDAYGTAARSFYKSHGFEPKEILPNEERFPHEVQLFVRKQIDKRLTFNEDEKNYDKYRPTYCKELFDSIIEYAKLDSSKTALEIGVGTGQATEPFLKTGCSVIGVELGNKLAEYSKVKFDHYSNFEIHNMAFEEYKKESGCIDLIYSATAFHWVDELSYEKVNELLRENGVLALFWNVPSGENHPAHEELQKVYDKYMPSPKTEKTTHEKYLDVVNKVKSYGFSNYIHKQFYSTRTFTAKEYLSLLDTYSGHRMLSNDVKEHFYADIESVINKHGSIVIEDTMDLYLMKKI